MSEVAKANNNKSGDDLGDGWVDVKIFHQHFQAHVVNENTNDHEQKITEQLYPSVQVGIMENDIAHEEEPSGEAHRE